MNADMTGAEGLMEVLEGAHPVMIALFGFMALVVVLAVPLWIAGCIVSIYQWIRGHEEMECGWGWLLNPNKRQGWCCRRAYHFGKHRR